MSPTVIDLGKKVKAKHPGQYDDMADDEVGRRVKAKFPGQYDDFAESTQSVPGMEKLGGAPPGAPKVQMPQGMRGPQKPVSIQLHDGDGKVMTPKGLDNQMTGFDTAVTAVPRFFAGGATQTGRGVTRMANPKSADDFAGGVADTAKGVGTLALPFAAPAMIARPVASLLAAGGGTAAGVGTEAGLRALGAPEGVSELGGVVAGGYTGGRIYRGTPDIPLDRGGAALRAGLKEAALNAPIVGKPIKAGLKAGAEAYEKSDPNYVDPKATAAAERQAQSLVNTKARVRAAAEERARIAAEKEAANALLPPEPQAPEPFRPNPAIRAKMPTSRSAGSDSGMPSSMAPPRPRTPYFDSDADLTLKPMPPPEPAPAPTPKAPEPFRPNPNILRKGKFGGPASGPPGMPSSRPVSVKPRVGPAKPKASVEAEPDEPVTSAAEVPATTTPPASGASAPEGSVVVPPTEGRPSRYGTIGGKLGQQVADAAHAKDTAVGRYLADNGITEEQIRATDDAQRLKWAREVNPKYKGYTDPERINDLIRMLKPSSAKPQSGGGSVAKSLSDAILDQQEQK